MVRPGRPTLSMWAHKALLNVLVRLWHCAGLGDVAVEYVVHFADLFYLVDEGVAHGTCSPVAMTMGLPPWLQWHPMATSPVPSRGSAALDSMASNGIHWQ